MSGDSGSSPTPPATQSTPAAPAATSPAATPAEPSGSEASPTVPSSTVTPTPQASGTADPTQDKTAPQAPPPERWPSILENARKKASTETLQRYGLTPNADPQKWAPHIQLLQTDPVAYHRALGDMLKQSGISVEPQAPPQPMTPPKPDLFAEDGRQAYSAEAVQQLLAIQQHQLEQRLNESLTPFQTMKEQMEYAQAVHESQTFAASEIGRLSQLDGFDRVRAKMGDLMRSDESMTVDRAYAIAIQDDLKTRDTRTRQTVLSEIQKAPATQDVRPGAPTPQVQRARNSNGRFTTDIDSAVKKAFAQHGG